MAKLIWSIWLIAIGTIGLLFANLAPAEVEGRAARMSGKLGRDVGENPCARRTGDQPSPLNATDPASVAARQQAQQAIEQIEQAIKGAGL